MPTKLKDELELIELTFKNAGASFDHQKWKTYRDKQTWRRLNTTINDLYPEAIRAVHTKLDFLLKHPSKITPFISIYKNLAIKVRQLNEVSNTQNAKLNHFDTILKKLTNSPKDTSLWHQISKISSLPIGMSPLSYLSYVQLLHQIAANPLRTTCFNTSLNLIRARLLREDEVGVLSGLQNFENLKTTTTDTAVLREYAETAHSKFIRLGGRLEGVIIKHIPQAGIDALLRAKELGIPSEEIVIHRGKPAIFTVRRENAESPRKNRIRVLRLTTQGHNTTTNKRVYFKAKGLSTHLFFQMYPEHRKEVERQISAIRNTLNAHPEINYTGGMLYHFNAGNFTVEMVEGKPFVRLIDWKYAKINSNNFPGQWTKVKVIRKE